MRRGEVWLADLNGSQPVVLLGEEGADGEVPAIQVVEPATAEQKRGFTFLDPDSLPDEVPAGAGPGITGIEVPIGPHEGLDPPGVVRLALPHEGHIFCTWRTGLTVDHLIKRLGSLSPTAMHRLDHALHLAGEG
jgi:mRNA interferase MazF